MPFADYLAEAVLRAARHDVDRARRLAGPRRAAARSATSPASSREMLRPTLVARGDGGRRDHGRSIPDLAGIVPGVGRFDPCPWGLGFEIRGAKSPHWTGRTNSPRTFGHFGGAGTMMWVDPDAGVRAAWPSPTAVRRLVDRGAMRCGRELSDAVRRPRSRRRMTFSLGDRVRWTTIGDDGLPLVRYGFVGGVAGDGGPVMVMLDGELGGDVIDLDAARSR